MVIKTSRVSTTPGNPGNLLDFNGPRGNYCVRSKVMDLMVSGHKTGTRSLI